MTRVASRRHRSRDVAVLDNQLKLAAQWLLCAHGTFRTRAPAPPLTFRAARRSLEPARDTMLADLEERALASVRR